MVRWRRSQHCPLGGHRHRHLRGFHLILVLAVYFVIAAKRRKDKEQNSKSGPPKFTYVPTTDSSALYPAPENNKSVSTIDLASVDQNKEILSQYQSGAVTIYDGRTVPIHWSTTQLLQEHERRHSPCGQQNERTFRSFHGRPATTRLSSGAATT
jgi:hypothetical protein